MDVAFREDDCRVRQGHADENFAALRWIALPLLKQAKTAKVGFQTKRLMSGWDEKYLLKVLNIIDAIALDAIALWILTGQSRYVD